MKISENERLKKTMARESINNKHHPILLEVALRKKN
jgi:hypothetical protein